MRMIFSHKESRRMRLPFRAALPLFFVGLLFQGCEDDPILEPTDDDSGGGSYGVISPLSAGRPADVRGSNPETF
jgi:hypothetical protein